MTLLALTLSLALDCVPAPTPPADAAGVAAVRDRLAATAAECLDAELRALARPDGLPVVRGDSALLVWTGDAESVAVAGDWTGWRPVALEPHHGLPLWTLAVALPRAARVDYKLVVDGDWVLDPRNPRRQWGGGGPNSELQMPGWRPEPTTRRRPSTPTGTLSLPDTLVASSLGEPVVVRVYTPARRAGLLPVVYVTDGHEYADDRLGALVTVMDEGIATGQIPPAAVVFIDPRWAGDNRRERHLVQNPAFAAWLAQDLVPWASAWLADRGLAARPDRDGRVILGTSLGGLFAAYLATEQPETFGRLAIQSPAYWVSEPNERLRWTGPSIWDRVAALPRGSLTVYQSTGTIRDTAPEARRMLAVLQAGDHPHLAAEVPEGHSWGAWRAQLADALGYLLPAP